jgi:hypothetical protein
VTVVGWNVSGDIGIDSAQLRSLLEQVSDALEQLSDALAEVRLTTNQKGATQSATHHATEALQDRIVNADTVESSLKRVGETLSQANVVMEEETPLWNSIARLARLLGPLVGGPGIVASWFGIALP